MACIQIIVKKHPVGARFGLSPEMLGISKEEFNILAKEWETNGGPGFEVHLPHNANAMTDNAMNSIIAVRTEE